MDLPSGFSLTGGQRTKPVGASKNLFPKHRMADSVYSMTDYRLIVGNVRDQHHGGTHQKETFNAGCLTNAARPGKFFEINARTKLFPAFMAKFRRASRPENWLKRRNPGLQFRQFGGAQLGQWR
jgi:hypothetical protein